MRLSFAILYLTSVAYVQAQTPAIASAQPNPVNAGGPGFTLTVNGTGFASGAVVKWSGAALATTFVSDSLLTATVPASLIAICGKAPLTVTNPLGVNSNSSYAVLVNPVLNGLSPNVAPAGSSGFTITASGLGFSSNVALILSGSDGRNTLPTNYYPTTTLTASIPASALTGVFPVSLQVVDTSSGGSSQMLPVTLLYAQISQIFPAKVDAGGSGFTLSVGGANFVEGAQVLWNTAPLVTRYNNSASLQATVPASFYSNPLGAPVDISVKNPGARAAGSTTLIVLPNPNGSTITSLDPAAAVTGGPPFTLTVIGSRFTQSSMIVWVTTPLATTFVDSTKLTATVPANLILVDGSASISVATPGVNPSNTFPLPIASPFPTVTSILPATVLAGGPAFTLTVNGNGFLPASIVVGVPDATTKYISLTQLTASVPASAIASVGSLAIRVTSPGGFTSPTPATLTVTALALVLSSLSPTAATVGGTAFSLTVNGSGFTANSKVQWNGTALSTTFTSPAQLTATVPANLIATVGAANVTVAGDGSASSPIAFAIVPMLPATSGAGIVNAASSTNAIAPGTLISIYGSNLASGNAPAAGVPLPVSLGGTTVQVNGTPAPLLFVSPVQINAQVPYETKPGTAKLTVQAGTQPGASVNFDVAATGPGVFVVPQTTHVLAQNLPDLSLNSAQAPALPGQYCTLYLTGQGALDTPVPSGTAAPGTPLSLPLAAVLVRIGGQPADVQFAGMAPGFVGLLQMNVKIPDVAAGEQTVDIGIGAVKASPTVISVGAR